MGVFLLWCCGFVILRGVWVTCDFRCVWFWLLRVLHILRYLGVFGFYGFCGFSGLQGGLVGIILFLLICGVSLFVVICGRFGSLLVNCLVAFDLLSGCFV